jgi:hypothetical protein
MWRNEIPREPDLPWDSREPTAGANVLRLVPAHRDACGTSPQVRGSPFDPLRPGQTPDSCLGVKGSPVQIRPSRQVFRTLVPRNGNETGHDHSHLTGRDQQKHPRRRPRHPDDRIAAIAEIPARRAGQVSVFPQQARVSLDQHAMRNSVPSAGAGRGRPGSPSSTFSAPNPPATSP